MKRVCFYLHVVVLAVMPLVADEGYSFFVSGYPAANVHHSATSTVSSLVASTRSLPDVSRPLEARYRSILASSGTQLYTTRFPGIKLFFK